MKDVVASIILTAVVIALIISVVIPGAESMKNVGETGFNAIKNMNSSIRIEP